MVLKSHTVYVKIFVVDLISLFSWLASIHENFSLSTKCHQRKFFPRIFCLDSELVTKLTVVVPDLHSNIPTSLLR